ncbi:9042_t:CDS:2 [Cetraspora pellucida]|uniref:9042_t:CDS:1 n=1 Tax=Cetraspora pellucida TaxID=1433469 RepID=A0A9N9GK51_9GLOM|nr:9042_t:CDS:2 [Cetraspora pellucida]
MTFLGTIACASVICHIFLHISGGPASEEWHVGVSVDIMLRSIVIIIVGVPPPENLVQRLRMKLFEKTYIDVTLRERGVVSTGHWKATGSKSIISLKLEVPVTLLIYFQWPSSKLSSDNTAKSTQLTAKFLKILSL